MEKRLSNNSTAATGMVYLMLKLIQYSTLLLPGSVAHEQFHAHSGSDRRRRRLMQTGNGAFVKTVTMSKTAAVVCSEIPPTPTPGSCEVLAVSNISCFDRCLYCPWKCYSAKWSCMIRHYSKTTSFFLPWWDRFFIYRCQDYCWTYCGTS